MRSLSPFGSCVRGLVLAALLASPVVGDDDGGGALSDAQRYWLYLNQGRDVTAFEAIGWDATGNVEKRMGRDQQFNAKRDAVLDDIARSEPRAEIQGSPVPADVVHGSGWRSLGGGPSHDGFTPDPGPVAGVERWRFPVGFGFRSGATVLGDTVYASSPGTETVLYLLDRHSGTIRGVIRKPRYASGIGTKAGGELRFHDEHRASLYGLNIVGGVADIMVVDTEKHEVLHTHPAGLLERAWALPEKEPEPRRAFVGYPGNVLIVQGVDSGRSWWSFPAGTMAAEPVQTEDMVFVGNNEGRLWGLRLEGPNRVAWTFDADAALRSRPGVDDDTVYVGANDGSVLAVNMRTGALRWRAAVASPNPRAHQLFSPPLIDGSRVFIGAADGFLYCVDATDGTVRWKADAGDWIRARPYVRDDVVVAATLSGEVLAFTDQGEKAVPAWRTAVSRHELFGDVAGDDTYVYVTSSHLWLSTLSLTDGAVQWQRRLLPNGGEASDYALADEPPQIPQSPPTAADGLVYVGGTHGLVQAVDADTGERVWRYEANGQIAAAPTIADGMVLVGEHLGGSRFTAVDARTGEPLWSRDIGGVWAAPVYENGRVYVGTQDGWMYALDADDGNTIWSWKSGGGIYPAPALDEENIYFGSWDGHYYALEKDSGAMVWAWSEPGYPYHIGGRPDSAAAVLHDGKLIVPALGGRYVAIDTASGETLWTWFPPPGRICNVTAAAHEGVAYIGVFGNTYVQPFGARLWAVDTETGEALWDVDTLGGLTSPVITGEGLLICGSLTSPYIEAYRLKDDRSRPDLAWRFRTQANMFESLPAVSGNLAFVLSADGWLHAIH